QRVRHTDRVPEFALDREALTEMVKRLFQPAPQARHLAEVVERDGLPAARAGPPVQRERRLVVAVRLVEATHLLVDLTEVAGAAGLPERPAVSPVEVGGTREVPDGRAQPPGEPVHVAEVAVHRGLTLRPLGAPGMPQS